MSWSRESKIIKWDFIFSASKGAVQPIGFCKWRDSLKEDESFSLVICNLLESECSTKSKAELNSLKHCCGEIYLSWTGWTAQTPIFKNLSRNKNRWLINILWKNIISYQEKTSAIVKSFCTYCYYKLIQWERKRTTNIWASDYAYKRLSQTLELKQFWSIQQQPKAGWLWHLRLCELPRMISVRGLAGSSHWCVPPCVPRQWAYSSVFPSPGTKMQFLFPFQLLLEKLGTFKTFASQEMWLKLVHRPNNFRGSEKKKRSK